MENCRCGGWPSIQLSRKYLPAWPHAIVEFCKARTAVGSRAALESLVWCARFYARCALCVHLAFVARMNVSKAMGFGSYGRFLPAFYRSWMIAELSLAPQAHSNAKKWQDTERKGSMLLVRRSLKYTGEWGFTASKAVNKMFFRH